MRDIEVAARPSRAIRKPKYKLLQHYLHIAAVHRKPSKVWNAGLSRHWLLGMLLAQHWFASAVRSLWQRSANNQNSRSIARICRRPKLKFHRGHARQLRRGHTGHRCFKLSARAASMSQRYLSTSSRNAGHFPGVEVSNASSTVNPKTSAPESAELDASRTFGLSYTLSLAWFGCGFGQWSAQSNKP